MNKKYSPFLQVAALAALTVTTLQPTLFAQAATTPAAPATVGAPPKFGSDDDKPEGKGPRKEWKRDPEKRLARLKEALGLTPEQETKIRQVFKDEADKLRAERQANKGNPPAPEERRAKMKAAREAVDTAISAVLTPEQKTKFEAMKAQRKNGPEQEPPPAPPAA